MKNHEASRPGKRKPASRASLKAEPSTGDKNRRLALTDFKATIKRLKAQGMVDVVADMKAAAPARAKAKGTRTEVGTADIQIIQFPTGYPQAARETVKKAVHLMYGALKDVKEDERIGQPELLQKASEALVVEAKTEQSAKSTQEAWQELLVKGLERKKVALQSPEFKSVSEVAAILDVGEPAIRKRIREAKMFAVPAPGTEEYRIPVWALAVSAEQTKSIHEASTAMDPWARYQFMASPNSWLKGLRPFDFLLPSDVVSGELAARRLEVTHYFGEEERSMAKVVIRALKQEFAEESRD